MVRLKDAIFAVAIMRSEPPSGRPSPNTILPMDRDDLLSERLGPGDEKGGSCAFTSGRAWLEDHLVSEMQELWMLEDGTSTGEADGGQQAGASSGYCSQSQVLVAPSGTGALLLAPARGCSRLRKRPWHLHKPALLGL